MTAAIGLVVVVEDRDQLVDAGEADHLRDRRRRREQHDARP